MATVFVRSKPVNWVRILPQMFMFLTDTTKTDFYIYWFVHSYWFLDVSIHVCSWSSLTRHIENAAVRSWSWSKWGDRGGVVIWWKICWHVFLRGHILGKFSIQNLTPFEKFQSSGKEEARLGAGIMNMRRQYFYCKPYRLHQSCLQWHKAL